MIVGPNLAVQGVPRCPEVAQNGVSYGHDSCVVAFCDVCFSSGPDLSWINFAAFAQPAPGTFGNIGRNSLRDPGFATVDFAVVKNTPIRVNAQFRVEMFNLFNRKNLPIPGPIQSSPPGDRLTSTSFGRINGTMGDYLGATGIGSGEPFNVQLALKIIF